MTTKEALNLAMSAAAGASQYAQAIKAIADSRLIPENTFCDLAGRAVCTLPRMVEQAKAEFQRAKIEYEKHCFETRQPAYATYDED